jgi:hypothetical protein
MVVMRFGATVEGYVSIDQLRVLWPMGYRFQSLDSSYVSAFCKSQPPIELELSSSIKPAEEGSADITNSVMLFSCLYGSSVMLVSLM